jgi:hypothetical protein
MQDTPAPQRIAVISVHGVADQQPGQTAQELTTLLQAHLPQQSAFAAHEVMIKVNSLGHADAKQRSLKLPRLPHSDFARERFAAAAQGADFDVEFSADMLRQHQVTGSDATYRTQRWRTQVTDATTPGIDVYEMYWADLSRLGSGAWRIVSGLYQLIFHLSSLGRHTTDLARAASAPTGLLSWLSRACAFSEYGLTGLLPWAI